MERELPQHRGGLQYDHIIPGIGFDGEDIGIQKPGDGEESARFEAFHRVLVVSQPPWEERAPG